MSEEKTTLKEDLEELEEAVEEFIEAVIEAYSSWWETGKEAVLPKTKDFVEKLYDRFKRQ